VRCNDPLATRVVVETLADVYGPAALTLTIWVRKSAARWPPPVVTGLPSLPRGSQSPDRGDVGRDDLGSEEPLVLVPLLDVVATRLIAGLERGVPLDLHDRRVEHGTRGGGGHRHDGRVVVADEALATNR